VRGWVGKAIKFLREVRSELRKVVWPTRRETVVFTSVVVGMVVVMAALFYVVDTILTGILKTIIDI